MILVKGHKLNPKYNDHQLNGELSAYRECHVIEVSDD
jgi:mRNA-degrading endonuclease YafQ of YafQ-DinJ toxin-antitoxin module